MNNTAPTIGSLIENEVRRQQMPITDFAKAICTKRGNAYNIFERNSIDIELLRRISKVLHHNFFEDLAKDMDLARPVEIDEAELNRLQAIDNFVEYVPEIFKELNIVAAIVKGSKNKDDEDIPFPDFILTAYNLTFTIGQTYEEKCNGFWENGVVFDHVTDSPGKMAFYTKQDDGVQFLDIAIELKTKEEWAEIIRFALEEIKYRYMPKTWAYLQDLKISI